MLISLIALLLAYSALSVASQIPLSTLDISPFNADFDKLVAETLAHWHTPGISIAVVDGEQTFSKVYARKAYPSGQLNSTGLRHRGLS